MVSNSMLLLPDGSGKRQNAPPHRVASAVS